jgi:hypothetical protein
MLGFKSHFRLVVFLGIRTGLGVMICHIPTSRLAAEPAASEFRHRPRGGPRGGSIFKLTFLQVPDARRLKQRVTLSPALSVTSDWQSAARQARPARPVALPWHPARPRPGRWAGAPRHHSVTDDGRRSRACRVTVSQP